MSIASRAAVSIDPASGELLAEHPFDGPAEIERALAGAAAAQERWAALGAEQRAAGLRRLAAELRRRREECAALITAEMGKAIGEARAEIEKCAWVCEYYAEHGARFLAPEQVETEWAGSYVQFPPLGVVLAVMPWNYPFWQVFRAGVPALVGGNAVVLKHASNVSGCARLVGEVVRGAELPAGLLEVLVVPSSEVAGMIADERIAAVTLTGSDAAGSAVAAACAAQLKKSVLELGGSDPFIVLEDADLEDAVATGLRARFQNAGQSCIAAKRFIVVEAVAEQFAQRLAAAADQIRVGDPTDEAVEMGPMSRADLRDELADQLRRAVAAGARVLTERDLSELPGAYFAPTVVDRVEPGTPAFAEETFGPLAAIVRVESEAAAIAAANDSAFGLSASLWTDPERGRGLAAQLRSGSVFVNAMSASDPRMPIGGIKRSGWGRELGRYGPREFVNAQSVIVAPQGEAG